MKNPTSAETFREFLLRQRDGWNAMSTGKERGDAYGYALREFDRIFSGVDQPTPPAESLHEMAKRMCDTFENCDGCPLDYGTVQCAVGVHAAMTDEKAAEQLEVMRQWASENPPKPAKTYLQDFFEKFPEAPRESNGYPMCCQEYVYKVTRNIGAFNNESVEASWDKPLGYWEA